jgi:hypothetical protein
MPKSRAPLARLAEKIERGEVAVRQANGTMPPDDLLQPIESTKTVGEVAVPQEPNEVTLLKRRLARIIHDVSQLAAR